MTTHEYLRTPESLQPQELVHGVCREAAAPPPRHQELVGSFFIALAQHVRSGARGGVWVAPIDVVLDRERHLVVQPDLIVVSAARLGIVTDRVWGAPDIALEVLSPMPRLGSVDERLAWFARYGVRECWLVHQVHHEVEVVQFEGGRIASRTRFERDQHIRSTVLPDFDRSMADIIGWS